MDGSGNSVVQTAFALIVAAIVLNGCTTTQERLSNAKTTQALVNVPVPQFNAPEACTAKTGRAYPSQQEPRVMLQQRWLFIADNRDQQSADCGAAIADYNKSIQIKGAK